MLLENRLVRPRDLPFGIEIVKGAEHVVEQRARVAGEELVLLRAIDVDMECPRIVADVVHADHGRRAVFRLPGEDGERAAEWQAVVDPLAEVHVVVAGEPRGVDTAAERRMGVIEHMREHPCEMLFGAI